MLADRIVEAQDRAAAAKAATAPVGNQRAQELWNVLQGNQNVQRTLQMIRSAEGTQQFAEPERVNFGNSRNASDLSSHPNVARPFNTGSGQQYTTATGAYQFLGKTWKGAADALGLQKFDRQSQDIAALHLIQQRGAMNEAKAGDVAGLARKLGGEWASLGYNNYGQPTRRLGFLQAAFNAPLAAGGTQVNYAPDQGGRPATGGGGGGGSKPQQPGAAPGGTMPNAADFQDVSPIAAFMQSARETTTSVGESSILQQLLQDQQAQHQALLNGSTQPYQMPLQLGSPVTFGG